MAPDVGIFLIWTCACVLLHVDHVNGGEGGAMGRNWGRNYTRDGLMYKIIIITTSNLPFLECAPKARHY